MIRYFCDDKRHIVCVPYSIANLHKMAEDLGLKRNWFHKGKNDNSHYDMPIKRIQEITSRCELVSSNEIVDIIRGRFTA